VVTKLSIKLHRVLMAAVRQRWKLQKMKYEATASHYRSNTDTVTVAEKQECADLNGRW